MRLFNTVTYELHEFQGSQVPGYSILSHRWEDQEVSFQDHERGWNRDGPGWRKIINACDVARHDFGQLWMWVDTCCIDKKSSAELTEAINSMYAYYRDSKVCMAYLSDVRSLRGRNRADVLQDFAQSQWFTRGWTLQELVAPRFVVFYTSAWEILGRKSTTFIYADEKDIYSLLQSAPNLNDHTAAITTIPMAILTNRARLQAYSAAERIRWASSRRTTRTEDEAYSLMGLLDVNMPLLYGEGRQAFFRLQQEIIRNSIDESMLWWKGDLVTRSLLTLSPSSFASANRIVQSNDVGAGIPRLTLQNGLIRLDIREQDECYQLTSNSVMHPDYLVRLRCMRRCDDPTSTATNSILTQEPSNSGAPPATPTPSDKQCFIHLVHQSCGHYRRACFDDADQTPDAENSVRVKEMTFYVQAIPGACCSLMVAHMGL